MCLTSIRKCQFAQFLGLFLVSEKESICQRIRIPVKLKALARPACDKENKLMKELDRKVPNIFLLGKGIKVER